MNPSLPYYPDADAQLAAAGEDDETAHLIEQLQAGDHHEVIAHVMIRLLERMQALEECIGALERAPQDAAEETDRRIDQFNAHRMALSRPVWPQPETGGDQW